MRRQFWSSFENQMLIKGLFLFPYFPYILFFPTIPPGTKFNVSPIQTYMEEMAFGNFEINK